MTVYSYSGKGNRETNEDYIKSEIIFDSISLHIVADGMGGYKYGEIAAQNATEAIFEFFAVYPIEQKIPQFIRQAIELANGMISNLQNQYHTKLGTTIAGVLIINNTGYAFWLGDVQIQHFRDNELLFVSESHSLINEMKGNGVVSAKDIDRYKNIVTRSLSGSPLEKPIPIVEIQLQQGDTICISSDGLYNSINPALLISKSGNEIESILKANEKSIDDNFSIIKIGI